MLKNTTLPLKTGPDGGYFEEKQYLRLIDDIISEGTLENKRNGNNTYVVFGSSMQFSLKDNKIPILTTKKVAWKTCLRELLWIMKGQTSNDILVENKVKIWTANASRSFDSRGLQHLRENDLGAVYGHQWRFFNAKYKDCDTDYTGEGVDQLQYIIDNLKNPETRNSRRLVMSA